MSFLSRLNPVPSFPPLPGPYQVGTVDVEIDAEDLHSPVPKPDGAPATIAYRIFYPCEKTAGHGRPVRWISAPQRENLAGFVKYMGVGDRVASMIATIPTPISYISLPATRSAPLLPPASSAGYPVTIFSHGLAGTRNLYSHLCSSLASHGQILIVPSHRDGSAPVARVRATPTSPAQVIHTTSISYAADRGNYRARDRQLRIRCWELGLVYASLIRINGTGPDDPVTNLDENYDARKKREDVLARFKGTMDLRPGALTFSGHSFGAATCVQFTKSVFWRDDDGERSSAAGSSVPRDDEDGGDDDATTRTGLFRPEAGGEIIAQITPATRLVLFDPWMMPLASPFQRALASRPLPALATGGPGGADKVLAIVSEGFWKWKQNLDEVRRLLRPDALSMLPPGQAWYAVGSRHFSQSDFGVLFSWLLERFVPSAAASADGRELLEGNVRLVNDMLRRDGVELAGVEGLGAKVEVEGEKKIVGGEEAIGRSSDDVDDAKRDPAQQVEHPISEALPALLDEKVWIKIPVLD